ncbi:MAG: hypothetical protein H6811_09140 [Phycisphaeraceae bacterium]|nr:hypothetical protein [Phycisphaeraceae bacterium]
MRTRVRALGVGGLIAAAGVAGCATQKSADVWHIRANPTPELSTLHERPADIYNNLALVNNENWRMFWSDLGRAMLLNRPSRLTPEPMPR